MSPPLGLYLHIPFCESKCGYCNFASGVYPQVIVARYLEALSTEIAHLRTILSEVDVAYDCFPACKVDTVYLGGGTPSRIDGSDIVKLFQVLREVFEFAPIPEITLEVNPGSVDPKRIEEYQEAGVNRISIGVQTFQDETLKRIGRSHNVQHALATVELFRKMGMNNMGIDIIAGLPGQTVKDWRENLNMLCALSPEHISLYMLEIHEDTRFGKVYQKGASTERGVRENPRYAALPDEDLVEQFYFDAIHQFEGEGYHQYEISNFAKPGRESRHNLKYWTDQPFIGFGCSAYSYLEGKRWGNERSVRRYMDLIQRQSHAVDSRSNLTSREREEEAIFLGLRLTRGIDLFQFETKFGFNLRSRFKEQIEFLKEGQLIELTPEHLRLTPKGYILSNEVFSEFLQ
jgi:oxygen-independent coproporphyrinogen-3 oxidase